MNALDRAQRPVWVRDAMSRLGAIAADVESQRHQLAEIALDLKSNGADTSEIADASHDLEHSWRHLTSTRRALAMSWPEEVE
jgi:hypothetical protein